MSSTHDELDLPRRTTDNQLLTACMICHCHIIFMYQASVNVIHSYELDLPRRTTDNQLLTACMVCHCHIIRVGQNRIYTYIYTVYLVIFKPKIPYVRRIYIWFWPTLHVIFMYQASVSVIQSRSAEPPCRTYYAEPSSRTISHHYHVTHIMRCSTKCVKQLCSGVGCLLYQLCRCMRTSCWQYIHTSLNQCAERVSLC
jgi:hypothetical protein